MTQIVLIGSGTGAHQKRTAVLLGVLAVVLVYAATLMIGKGEQQRRQYDLTRLSLPDHQVPHLQLELLAARGTTAHSYQRDPFSYAPSSAGVRAEAAPQPRPQGPKRQAVKEPPAAPVPLLKEPSFPWAYLGHLGPVEQLVAVFRSGDRSVEVAVVGEVVADSFTVHAIGLESAQVVALEHNDRLITVPLAKD